MASLDEALAGGWIYGCVHEVYAAEAADFSAAAGFVASLATGMGAASHVAEAQTALWLRSRRSAEQGGIFQANGWAELGGSPAGLLVGVVADTKALLRAAVDALRCGAIGTVIVECWGPVRELDLTASRRLTLATEKSGVTLFLLRTDAAPAPSAAQTRWQVASAPSHALPGNTPGWPTFDIELLRQKSGPGGLGWRVEWDRDRRKFRDAALSGSMVPVPAGRPAADTGSGSPHQIGRHAA